MLVDDEPNILEFLELGLQNEGFEVQSAQDGMTAVNLIKDFQPHVVILDVMMPGMDGFEVCQLIKKTDNVAVIMLTARDEVDDRVKGLTLGADDYMVKPLLSFVAMLFGLLCFLPIIRKTLVPLFNMVDTAEQI